ncbi:hypothetical protein J2W48_003745 [Flavobacterium piscis]|uniref:Uncharacterized protein n=1 Tax=Flavobacterium piscis TaxID=1114874 RepID=A0ABU1YCG1_9FLAO|nr:hypothetical protein [Flavobacterium piscis]
MIIRKLTDPIFIHLSKIYIHFYQDQKEYWRMFPSLILSFLFTTNVEIFSFYFVDINKYYYVGLGVFFILFFFLIYKNIKYEYVKEYKMSNKTRIIITVLIVVDLAINFICLNIMRNGKFMW